MGNFIKSRSWRIPFRFRFAMMCVFSLSFWAANAEPIKETQTDPALIQALHQETYDSLTKSTNMDQLVWLSTMSSRLERRIPNAFYRIRLLSAIYQESRAEGLDPQLVLALIEVESNFDRYALSHAGAQGLMQVMPFWKKEIGKPDDDLFNPLVSLRYGCRILRHYLDRYPNAVEALAAYNGSHGRTIYPDKVLGRLNSSWRFKSDQYASDPSTSKLAITEPTSRSTGRDVLN